MAEAPKDTIYIDVEDEITTVIDKVVASDKKLVALVLPKRAAVFQSIVNMKLLKRKADSAKKNLVLITTESSLLPLAGSVGLYVAKTLSSKPEIPNAPINNESVIEANEDDSINLNEETEEQEADLKALAAVPIGALTAKKVSDKPKTIPITNPDDAEIESIELDNTAEPEAAQKSVSKKDAKAQKKADKKNKDLKVPNFERFRKWLFIGGIAFVVLLVGGYLLLKTLPKATINIQTDAANVNTSVDFTLSTSAKTLNPANNTVPAKLVTENKTYTATANATGTQNNGQAASGSITMSSATGASCPAAPSDLPAGSGITSNGLTFITQQDTTFILSLSSNHKQCTILGTTLSGSSNIPITAQKGGSAYNLNNAYFAIPGYSIISGNGTTSGGTDNNVQIVTQADITNAQNKIATDASTAKQDLSSQLSQANYYPITETFTSGTPTITPNAAAGTAASSVTVTETVSYSMYGARYSDLQTLVTNNINSQTTGTQTILTDGLNNATFTSNGSPTSIAMQTTAVVGPNINPDTIKQDSAGKSSSEIQTSVSQIPHVTSVSVKFSPFYVSKAPTNTSKITVNIAKPTNAPSK